MNSTELKQLEKRLWAAADNLRANAGLKASQYATPILGLIFLKFADNKYAAVESEVNQKFAQQRRSKLSIDKIALGQCGFYLPPEARYDHLLGLPETSGGVLAKAIKTAMEQVEQFKPELEGVLPKDEYFQLQEGDLLGQLLREFKDIPADLSGDLFGKIYEYFLGNFALAEGQGGGEFFTPESVVRLMVEMIEPHGGTVFDPACGSGGMFVQSASFIERHRGTDHPDVEVFGQEKEPQTVKLAKMNLAVNGLRGHIKAQNSYYKDPFESMAKFDYVLANPPFNVDDVNYDEVAKDPRFNTYGIPRKKGKLKANGKETVPNGNYLWINLFATSLKPKGRAALVMANSASDARHSEADIRQKLIESDLIYGMLSLPSNLFYTVTLPATLWFFDKDKQDDRLLFIDARSIFVQIDRAHREFSEPQIQNIALISKLHKGKGEAFIEQIEGYFSSAWGLLEAGFESCWPLYLSLRGVFDKPQRREVLLRLNEAWHSWLEWRGRWEAHETRCAELTLVSKKNEVQRAWCAEGVALFEFVSGVLAVLEAEIKAEWDVKAAAVQEARLLLKAAAKKGKTKGESKDKKTAEEKRQLGLDVAVVKAAKEALSLLQGIQQQVKEAERFYGHVGWLQARFPAAKYEDVTGLCKLATKAEVKEQDYSLNPGRYVGVVIEEDGRTEGEFASEIAGMQEQLNLLSDASISLHRVISSNIKLLVGK